MSETIGSRFREERERLGLSQVAAAEICGVRREIVGRWERGMNTPSGEALAAFGRHGADVFYILVGHSQDAPQPIILAPDEIHLVDGYRALTDEARAKVGAYLDAALEFGARSDRRIPIGYTATPKKTTKKKPG